MKMKFKTWTNTAEKQWPRKLREDLQAVQSAGCYNPKESFSMSRDPKLQ